MDHGTDSLLGWGYEGKSVDDLLDFCAEHAVVAVVDVRLNAISRKKGFSKGRLAQAVRDAGVAYVHLSSLGNPKDNREGFAFPGTASGVISRERYCAEVLDTDEAAQALEYVRELASQGPVALLCFEATHDQCHRSLVQQAVLSPAATS